MEIINTELAVLGGGPGGYAAAFYAADKGKQVILIEQERRLGGVCLNSFQGLSACRQANHGSQRVRSPGHFLWRANH